MNNHLLMYIIAMLSIICGASHKDHQLTFYVFYITGIIWFMNGIMTQLNIYH